MGDLFVRCRGLPFSATEAEVREFLGGKGIKKVHLTNTRDGRPSGEAFIECEDEESFNTAMSKDRGYMGSRYIEVFRVSAGEMAPFLKGTAYGPSYGASGNSDIPSCDHVVRLRGLPFQCSKDEIHQFFAPLAIANDGVILPHERQGRRSNGEAFVLFSDSASASKALEKNRQNIQHRYIEVFSSSRADLMRALEGHGHGGDYGSWEGYGGGKGGGGNGYGRGGYDDIGYGGGSRPSHRPGPYDRPIGGGHPGYGGGGGGGYRDRPYSFERPYGGGGMEGGYGASYDYGYGRGYDGGDYGAYGYDAGSGDWGGYEASYDYGPRHGGGGPMRGGRGGNSDNWRNEGRGGSNVPRSGGPKLSIKMRGIPFRCSEGDIYEFFAPLRPSSIEILREQSGRPSGEARVEFTSRQEFDDALLKDKQYMGARYVELFPDHH